MKRLLLLFVGLVMLSCTDEDATPTENLYTGSLVGTWKQIEIEVNGAKFDTSSCEDTSNQVPRFTYLINDDGSMKMVHTCDPDSDLFNDLTYTFAEGVLTSKYISDGFVEMYKVTDLGNNKIQLHLIWSESNDSPDPMYITLEKQ